MSSPLTGAGQVANASGSYLKQLMPPPESRVQKESLRISENTEDVSGDEHVSQISHTVHSLQNPPSSASSANLSSVRNSEEIIRPFKSLEAGTKEIILQDESSLNPNSLIERGKFRKYINKKCLWMGKPDKVEQELFLNLTHSLIERIKFIRYHNPLEFRIILYFENQHSQLILNYLKENDINCIISENKISISGKEDLTKFLKIFIIHNEIRITGKTLENINKYISPFGLMTNEAGTKLTDQGFFSRFVRPYHELTEKLDINKLRILDPETRKLVEECLGLLEINQKKSLKKQKMKSKAIQISQAQKKKSEEESLIASEAFNQEPLAVQQSDPISLSHLEPEVLILLGKEVEGPAPEALLPKEIERKAIEESPNQHYHYFSSRDGALPNQSDKLPRGYTSMLTRERNTGGQSPSKDELLLKLKHINNEESPSLTISKTSNDSPQLKDTTKQTVVEDTQTPTLSSKIPNLLTQTEQLSPKIDSLDKMSKIPLDEVDLYSKTSFPVKADVFNFVYSEKYDHAKFGTFEFDSENDDLIRKVKFYVYSEPFFIMSYVAYSNKNAKKLHTFLKDESFDIELFRESRLSFRIQQKDFIRFLKILTSDFKIRITGDLLKNINDYISSNSSVPYKLKTNESAQEKTDQDYYSVLVRSQDEL